MSQDPPNRGEPPAGALPAETLALLGAVLSSAPFGFALVDADQRYILINEALAAINGRTPEEHRGLRPSDISPELEGLVGPILHSVLSTGEPVIQREVSATPPGGAAPHEFLFSAYPVSDADGRRLGVAVAVVDVTDRLQTLRRLESQARQQSATVEIGMAALRGEHVRDVIHTALQVVRGVLGVDRAVLLRQDQHSSSFLLEAIDPAGEETGEVMVRPGDRSITGQTLRLGAPIISPDVEDDDRFDTMPAAGGMPVASAATVLIPGTQGPFGVLAVFSSRPQQFTDDDTRFVQAVANVIGTAVERRRTERALETSDRRLRMAQEAGRMGVWEWDLRTDEIIWSEALELLWGLPPGGFQGTFESFRKQVHPDDLARVEDTVGQARSSGGYDLEHRILRADTGEVRWIVARGDVIRDDEGTPIRMVGINVDITERKVVEEERYNLLRAEQAARAAAERSRERLTFLSEATGVLSASLEYHETLQAVTRLAVPDFASICIIDLLDGGRLATVAVAHADRKAEQLVWRMRRTYPAASAPDDPVRETLRYAQPLLFAEMPQDVLASMAADDQHLRMLNDLDIRSGIIVPLIARGRVLGTLSLLRTSDLEPFEGVDDQTLVMELGRRAALAIDNARLYAEAGRTGERFRRMAETLQASLLPPTLPTVPGVDIAATYRAAAAGTTVGGDFYDVFPLTDRGWGVVIGDVQGKGTEAATVTGIARHTIRTAAMRRGPIGSLRTLNEALLHGEEHDDRFCTVLYGQLEVADDGMNISLASGGHPPALLRRAGGTVELIGGGGSLLGVLEDLQLESADAVLHPGDALVLYTDGVTEARGAEGEFGEQRLMAVVAGVQPSGAAEIAAAIEHAVTEFSGGQFRDDVAILALYAT